MNGGEGRSTRYISSDRQYGSDVTPGIDRQTNFWRGGGFAEYDWRDRASRPTSGGKYLAQYVRDVDQDLGGYSFLRLDLDASQYIGIFNGTRVIALHGSSSLTTTGNTQRVPFYLQPTLGGPDTLRGHRINRFYGARRRLGWLHVREEPGDSSGLLESFHRKTSRKPRAWEASGLKKRFPSKCTGNGSAGAMLHIFLFTHSSERASARIVHQPSRAFALLDELQENAGLVRWLTD